MSEVGELEGVERFAMVANEVDNMVLSQHLPHSGCEKRQCVTPERIRVEGPEEIRQRMAWTVVSKSWPAWNCTGGRSCWTRQPKVEDYVWPWELWSQVGGFLDLSIWKLSCGGADDCGVGTNGQAGVEVRIPGKVGHWKALTLSVSESCDRKVGMYQLLEVAWGREIVSRLERFAICRWSSTMGM
jgi:hypothetical protein